MAGLCRRVLQLLIAFILLSITSDVDDFCFLLFHNFQIFSRVNISVTPIYFSIVVYHKRFSIFGNLNVESLGKVFETPLQNSL